MTVLMEGMSNPRAESEKNLTQGKQEKNRLVHIYKQIISLCQILSNSILLWEQTHKVEISNEQLNWPLAR